MISPEHFEQIRNEFIANLPKILEGKDPLITNPQVPFKPEPDPVTLARLADETCEHFGLSIRHFKSRSRKRQLAWPRQIFCLLASELTTATQSEIARFIDRDHSTVRSSISNARSLVSNYSRYRKAYMDIKAGVSF